MGELLRRRALMTKAGDRLPPPFYSTSGDISGTSNTGILLFDTPKSFTVYCEATLNNYNWTGSAVNECEAIFGINSSRHFYVGRCFGNEYLNNTLSSSGIGRYTAVSMNEATNGVKMSSLYARSNKLERKIIAVTYNHMTRTVHGYTPSKAIPNKVWWSLSSDLISNLPILLNFRGADSVVNVFEIYDYCMTDDDVRLRFST